jgi:hypothetical protein
MKELLVSDVAGKLPARIKNILAGVWNMPAKDFCDQTTVYGLSRIPNCGTQTVALLVRLFKKHGFEIDGSGTSFGIPDGAWGRSAWFIAGATFRSRRLRNIMLNFMCHMIASKEDLGDEPSVDMEAEEFCRKYTLTDILKIRKLRVTALEGRDIQRAFRKEGITLRTGRSRYERAVRRIRELEAELGLEPSTGW